MSAVIDFANDLWKSILTPGVTPVLVQATHFSFASLIIVLIFMLVSTKSLHFVALLLIASGLWASITWFVSEIRKMEEEKRQQELKEGKSSSSTSTATEGKEGKEAQAIEPKTETTGAKTTQSKPIPRSTNSKKT